MTMVWPSSAPSQMRLVGVLETREHVYCEKIKCRCPAPERFRAGSGQVGTLVECTVLVRGEEKSTGVGPLALRAGSGRFGALERAVVLLREETTQLLYVPSVGQSVTVGVF